jgi:hypothetical protein
LDNFDPREKQFDWRFRALTFITDSADKRLIGGFVHSNARINYGSVPLVFPEPSGPAIFLGGSQRAFEDAREHYPFPTFAELAKLGIVPEEVFDYIEKMSAAVIFAYAALEAFANELIPDEYVHQKERRDRTGTRAIRKDEVEREVSLDEKLHAILPVILHKASPKGSITWQKYGKLQKARHRIIHLKSGDQGKYTVTQTNLESAWNTLLDPSPPHYPLIAKEMMLWWYRGSDGRFGTLPFWLRNCPIGAKHPRR